MTETLQVIDVSDPYNPTLAGQLTGNGTTVLRGVLSLFIQGNYLYYSSTYDNGIQVVDITDPNNLTPVAQLIDTADLFLNDVRTLYAQGNYLFTGSFGEGGVQIIDISDPTNPTAISNLAHNGTDTFLDAAYGSFIQGNFLYVASIDSDSFQIIELNNNFLSNLEAGTLKTSSLAVDNFSIFNGDLSVRGGINTKAFLTEYGAIEEEFRLHGTLKDGSNEPGTMGQILSSTGTGTQWIENVNTIADADRDTQIQVEESADEDIIRFDVVGLEGMTLAPSPSTISYVEPVSSTPFAGYSLRKAVSAYTGPAIRVRRSSDDTEQDINFTTANELDTDALTTFVGAGNDGFVTTWYDQAGSNDMIQPTAANQPRIVIAGTVQTMDNGTPAIDFVAADFLYRTTSDALLSSPSISSLVIGEYNSTGTWMVLHTSMSYYLGGADRKQFSFKNGGTNAVTLNTRGSGGSVTQGATAAIGYTAGASGSFVSVNGTQTSITDGALPTNAGNHLIFGDHRATGYFVGKQSEALFYTSVLSSSDYTAIEDNQEQYWTNASPTYITGPVPSVEAIVYGDAQVTGILYDSDKDAGTAGQVLTTTASGTNWADASAAGTDDQNIANLAVNATTNVLTVGIEDGTSQTVDLSHLDDTGTDDQNIANLAVNATTNVLTVGIEDGTSQTVDLSGIVKEPWFTVGTTDGHTANTGDMFFSGNIGVGTNTLSAGKAATFAGDVDIQGVLDPTKIILSGDGSVGSFNPTTNNQYEIEFQEGRDLEIKSNTTNNILHIENAGNVGIGTNAPTQKLDVNGSGLFRRGGNITPTINCCLASMEQPITSMPCAHDIIAVLMLGMPLIFLLGMQEQMLMQTILPFME